VIAVGAFFLARNLWPEWHLQSWLRQYWPVLVIALGVAMLVERLAASGRGACAERNRAAGGFWQ
jgi:hypothetical protein